MSREITEHHTGSQSACDLGNDEQFEREWILFSYLISACTKLVHDGCVGRDSQQKFRGHKVQHRGTLVEVTLLFLLWNLVQSNDVDDYDDDDDGYYKTVDIFSVSSNQVVRSWGERH